MNWDRWLMTDRGDGIQEFTPYEPHEDGSFDVVMGMCLISSVDEVVKRGAVKIVQVDDLETLDNPRILHDSTT